MQTKIPQNKEMEYAVLSVALLVNNKMAIAIDRLTEDAFYDPIARQLYKLMSDLFIEGVRFDSMVILQEAPKRGYDLINQSSLSMISSINASSMMMESYCNRLSETHLRRVLMSAGSDLVECSQMEDLNALDTINNTVSELSNTINKANDSFDIKTAVDEHEKQVQEFVESGRDYMGLETGFKDLDFALDGIQDGHFGIVTAYTSTGKTAFILNIVNSFLEQGKRCVFFSLEMSPKQLVGRLLAVMTGINIWNINHGKLNDAQAKEVHYAREKLRNYDLTIHNNASWRDIQMKILKEGFSQTADLFVIDYLGLIQTGNNDKRAGLMEVSTTLQSVMQKFDIPLIALSQISNAGAKNDFGDFIDTKDSGDIAASADWVLRLRNAEKDREEINRMKREGEPIPIECSIQKNRHGLTTYIDLFFDTQKSKFMDKDTYESANYCKSLNVNSGENPYSI